MSRSRCLLMECREASLGTCGAMIAAYLQIAARAR